MSLIATSESAVAAVEPSCERIFKDFPNRPDIDGLRAVAVLAVVFYHARFGCPGGYVGVDVFFVISGFLITKLIWKDLESGKFSFAHFWERRARRIAPAVVVVTTAVLAAGWLFMAPEDYANLGRAAAALALFSANIFYKHNTGYFDGASEEKPLLHTWSLAVEEQFYFIVPFLLWGMFQFPALRKRMAIIVMIGTAVLVSFALSVYELNRSVTATFYLLPTRAWELGVGSLTAFMPASAMVLGRRYRREIMAIAGFALIAASVFFYTTKTRFPGIAALPPCIGTALVIYANAGVSTSVGICLSFRPVVFIGLISYSLYLWHWPFLAFGRYLALDPQSYALRGGLVSVAFLVSILSWKFVEAPFRERRLGRSRRSMYGYAAAGLASLLLVGWQCRREDGFRGRYSVAALKYLDAAQAPRLPHNIRETLAFGKSTCLGADPSVPPSVFVWGDSHANASLPAVDALLKEMGISGRSGTLAGNAPLLDYSPYNYKLHDDIVHFNRKVFSYIEEQRISDTIIICYWSKGIDRAGDDPDALADAIVSTVGELASIGTRPWVMLEVPIPGFHVPRVLSSKLFSSKLVEAHRLKPERRSELEAIDPEIIDRIEAAGGQVLDPKPAFLDPANGLYLIEKNGEPLYSDDNHLSVQGAQQILLPILRQNFHPTMKADGADVGVLRNSLEDLAEIARWTSSTDASAQWPRSQAESQFISIGHDPENLTP